MHLQQVLECLQQHILIVNLSKYQFGPQEMISLATVRENPDCEDIKC